MRQDGFTLVELLVIISIATILMTLATVNFREWTLKYSIESQISEMYADLTDARVRATTRNRMYFVNLETGKYSITEDSDNDGSKGGTDLLVVRKNVKNRLAWSGAADISFDTRGLASANDVISVANTVRAAYDCVTVSMTRIYMGKMTGGLCVQK